MYRAPCYALVERVVHVGRKRVEEEVQEQEQVSNVRCGVLFCVVCAVVCAVVCVRWVRKKC